MKKLLIGFVFLFFNLSLTQANCSVELEALSAPQNISLEEVDSLSKEIRKIANSSQLSEEAKKSARDIYSNYLPMLLNYFPVSEKSHLYYMTQDEFEKLKIDVIIEHIMKFLDRHFNGSEASLKFKKLVESINLKNINTVNSQSMTRSLFQKLPKEHKLSFLLKNHLDKNDVQSFGFSETKLKWLHQRLRTLKQAESHKLLDGFFGNRYEKLGEPEVEEFSAMTVEGAVVAYKVLFQAKGVDIETQEYGVAKSLYFLDLRMNDFGANLDSDHLNWLESYGHAYWEEAQ